MTIDEWKKIVVGDAWLASDGKVWVCVGWVGDDLSTMHPSWNTKAAWDRWNSTNREARPDGKRLVGIGEIESTTSFDFRYLAGWKSVGEHWEPRPRLDGLVIDVPSINVYDKRSLS